MISIDPKTISTGKLHGYLLGAVSPRPICFASTIDGDGLINLSPFSFFNVFSAQPPIMIFSPARRVRDNTTKHSLENVLEIKEVVINIVSYQMVQQMSLSSTEYPKGVNEFVKAGFTEMKSDIVTPPRVAEAPVQFECKVNDVVALGKEGGAGNLIICEVVKIHINEEILNDQGSIDPKKIDTVARMGGNWYSRAKDGMFEVPKPIRTMGIGIDALPSIIRSSNILNGNDLGKLGNVESLPSKEDVESYVDSENDTKMWFEKATDEDLHLKAKELLENDLVMEALNTLLVNYNFNK